MNRSQKKTLAVSAALGLSALAAGAFVPGAHASPRLIGIGLVRTPLLLAVYGAPQADVSETMAAARKALDAGQFEQALTAFNTVLKQRPDYTAAYFDRGRTLFALNRFAEAGKDFALVTQQKPANANGWYNLGMVQQSLQNPDFAGSIASFTKVIDLNPKASAEGDLVAESYDKRAFAYLQQKNFNAAVLDSSKLIERDSKRVTAYLNRAYAYMSLNPPQTQKAAADYASALPLATSPDDKAGIYFALAQMDLAGNKYPDAISHLSDGLKIKPDNAAAYAARAAAYFQTEKYDLAAADYNQVITRAGNTELGNDALKNRGAVFMKLKQYPKAISDYSAYLQKVPNPPKPDVYKFRASAYMNAEPRNLAGAISDYERYVAVEAKDAVAWRDLSGAYYASGAPAGNAPFDASKAPLLEKAINAADRATALDNKQAAPYLFKGDSLSLLGRFDPAVAAYAKYIDLMPKDSSGYDGRGRAYFNLKRYNEAVSDFDRFLAIKPGDKEIQRLRVLAFDASSGSASPAEKIAAYKKALDSNPSDPVLWTNLGVVYFGTNDFDNAIMAFTKASDLAPNNVDYLNNAASAYMRKADKTKAAADYAAAATAYGKVLAKQPNNADALAARGDLNMTLKRWPDAVADYTKFIGANPAAKEIAAVYTNRATAYLRMTPANYAGAIADYGQVIAKEPNNASVYNLRGLAYNDQKNYAAAVTDFGRYIELSAGKADPEAYLARAGAYFNVGEGKRRANDPSKGAAEFEKAASDYTLYLNARPGDAPALFSRGLAYFRQSGNKNLALLNKAIADFDAAIKARPGMADAYYYLGLAYDNYGSASEPDQESMFNKAIDAYTRYTNQPGLKPADTDPVKKRIAELKAAL